MTEKEKKVLKKENGVSSVQDEVGKSDSNDLVEVLPEKGKKQTGGEFNDNGEEKKKESVDLDISSEKDVSALDEDKNIEKNENIIEEETTKDRGQKDKAGKLSKDSFSENDKGNKKESQKEEEKSEEKKDLSQKNSETNIEKTIEKKSKLFKKIFLIRFFIGFFVFVVAIISIYLFLSFFEKKDLEERNRQEIARKEYNEDLFQELLKKHTKRTLKYEEEVGANESDQADFLDQVLEARNVGVYLFSKNREYNYFSTVEEIDLSEENTEKKEEIVYVKNFEEKISLASVAKIMTALVVLEKSESKNITIPLTALLEEGDHGLLVGENFYVKDLVAYMLMVSSNDAARALSETYTEDKATSRKDFIKAMNQKTQELGMCQTIFFSESGLDVSSQVGGAYSTVDDIFIMMKEFYREFPVVAGQTTIFSKYIFSRESEHSLVNTNKLLEDNKKFLLSKTGYTDLTGGNLVTLYDVGNEQVAAIIVLGSSREGRFTDTMTIIKSLEEYMQKKK